MAKGRGLSYKAQLDTAEALRKAKEFNRELTKLSKVSIGANGVVSNKAFDSKPLTEYQAGILKIKQQQADLAKKKAEDAAAERKARQEQQRVDKAASLALQAALKEETRLKREQVAMQKQMTAEASKKRPAQISNTAQEIANYKNSIKGVNAYTVAINAETVARIKLSAESARAAVANNTLNTGTQNYTTTTNTQTQATNRNVLSKKQLAQMLAEEKLRQAAATAELKNNAREMLNAKGSIEQRRAALIRLTTVYDRLSKAERESASGTRMASIIKGVSTQVSELEKATNRAQRSVGGYAEGISSFFKSVGANILSVMGPIALITAAWAAAKAAFSHNTEISDTFTDVQRTAKMSGVEVDQLGKQLKAINTRTNLDSLLDIGFEGGRLGVAKDELVDFITTVDKLAVVLKKEIPGGAAVMAEELGRIAMTYKIAQNEGITLAEGMNKVGSSFLDLAHSGSTTVKYLQAFALQVAGTAVTSKLALPVIAAYGSVLQENGQVAHSAGLALTRVVNDLTMKRGKYFAIAQLEDANLTLDKFTHLINTDTKAALDLFFKGLKAGNASQTEMGDRLQSVGLRTGKVSNAVKILVAKYDELQGKIKISTDGYVKAESISHNFELANNSLAASFEKIKNSISNAFTDSAAQRGLAALLNAVTDNRTEAEKTTAEYMNVIHTAEALEKAVDPLVKKYDELIGKTTLNAEEQEELRSVTAKIGLLLPSVITEFDNYGNAIDINRGKVKELSKAQAEYLRLQYRTAIQAANMQFDNTQSQLPGAKNEAVNNKSNRLSQFLFNGGKKTDDDLQYDKDRITRLSNTAYTAAKAVRDLGGALTEAQKKVIEYYEAVDKKPVQPTEILGTGELVEETEVGRTIEDIKQDIKSLTTANKKLAVASKEFKDNVIILKGLRKELKLANGGTVTGGASDRTIESAVSSQRSMQAEIDALTKKGRDKQLSDDEQELADVDAKYKKLTEKAIAFNNKKSNIDKGLKVNTAGLAVAQATEKKAITQKKEVEDLKVSLDQQAELYAAYEDTKSKIGKEKADERFETELGNQKTYLERLYKQREDMVNPGKAKGGSEEEQAANQAALALLDERIKKAEELKQKADDEKYARALQAAMTAEQAIMQVNKEYIEMVTALGSDATDEQIANLDRKKKAAIQAINEEHSYIKSGYEELMQDFDSLTRKQIADRLNKIKAGYRKEYAEGKLTAEQLAEKTKQANDELDKIGANNSFARITKSVKEYKEAVAAFGKESVNAKEAQKGMFAAFAEGAADVSSLMGDLGSSFEQLGIGGEGLQTALKNAKGIVDGAGKIATGLASGDVIAVISGSIGMLTSAISSIFGDKDKKIQKSIDRHEAEVKRLSNAYKQLERDINNSVGKAVKKAQEDQIANLKAQQAEIVKMRQAEIDKKKTDDSKVADYEERIAQLDQDVLDLKKSMNEALTGTTSKSITDSIIQGFRDGKRSIADFADTFKDLMKGALYAALQEDLEPEIEAFYKRFIEASKDGLTDKEYGDLQKDYDNVIDKQLDKVSAIDKITGGASSGSSGSTLQGDIKSITTEQAGVLTGTMNGMRLAQLDSNRLLTEGNKVRFDAFAIAKGSFDVVVKIEQHTFRTANNTDRLESVERTLASIDRKIGASGQALAANGR